ncbi:3097_t:CDS:1 [Acaulospora colombiana]|uniref:3097_t:CDS:1 n=1 Tax=Acaulospora colombiana TaxID=27376 RepID=A0ACA9JYZ4_9GLOM|nr:3097_t:CDS:1 [Acaulospora colombiana]
MTSKLLTRQRILYALPKFTPYKISLVSLDWIRKKDPPVALGHACIKASLFQSFTSSQLLINDHVVNLFQNTLAFDELCKAIAQQILSTSPDFIAFGVFVWNEMHTQRILNLLRNDHKYKGLILCGGPQISYAPKGTLELCYPQVDYFIRGYAENAMVDLVRCKIERKNRRDQLPTLNAIQGLHIASTRDHGTQALVDLNSSASPFQTSPPIINVSTQRFIRWESQRGCPFRCSFCAHRDAAAGRTPIGPQRVKRDLNLITNVNSIVNDIAILDPTFNSGKGYLSVLDHFIEASFKGRISLQTRFEMVTRDFLERCELLKDEVTLEFGIQTAIRTEQREIQRSNNLKRITEIAKELTRREIMFEVSLIYGLPNQTVESFRISVDFVKTLGATKIHAWPLMLLRGTELERRKTDLGLREEILIPGELKEIAKERLSEGIPHVTSSPSFTRDEWMEMNLIAETLFQPVTGVGNIPAIL